MQNYTDDDGFDSGSIDPAAGALALLVFSLSLYAVARMAMAYFGWLG